MVEHAREQVPGRSAGFTLTELLFVALIIGILVAIILPVLAQVAGHAQKKACFANQRTIEGAAMVWQSSSSIGDVASLAGVVNGAHQLVTGGYVKRPPYCPGAPRPADINNPSAAEGAYTLTASATVAACTFGSLGAHGSFHAP